MSRIDRIVARNQGYEVGPITKYDSRGREVVVQPRTFKGNGSRWFRDRLADLAESRRRKKLAIDKLKRGWPMRGRQ